MKKISILMLLILLTFSGCGTYQKKEDINPNYYIEYLQTLNYLDIELLQQENISQDTFNLASNIFDIYEETSSNTIYHYVCYDSDGTKYHAYMPDKVGEEDLVFKEFINDVSLIDIVSEFNATTSGEIITIEGTDIDTLNIILNEDDNLTMKFVDDLLIDRSVNGVEVNINKDNLRTIIVNSLSNPIIYNIGRYYIYGVSNVHTVYIAEGKDDNYILLLEDFNAGTIEVLYSY